MIKQKMYGAVASAVLGIALSACGSSTTTKAAAPTTAPTDSATTLAPPSTAAPTTAASLPATTSTTAAAPVASPTAKVAQHPKEGAILVDAAGHTLYIFELDKGTTSSCTGGCAQVWPGFSAASPVAGSGLEMAKLGVAAGQVPGQVTYNGHLLYYFAGDKAAGDIKGVGIKDWFPIGPDGNKVTIGSTDM